MHYFIMIDGKDDDFVDIIHVSPKMLVELPPNRKKHSPLYTIGSLVGSITWYGTSIIGRRIRDQAVDYVYAAGTQFIYTAITGYIIMSLRR